MSHPNLENLPLRRAKTVVQYTSARQLTGLTTIGQLLLLLLLLLKQKGHRKIFFAGQSLTPPKMH